MASKAEPKITRRQVNNLRAESMRYATTLMSRLRMSVLGKPAIEKCECGKEHEIFPNQPTKLDTAQANLLKFDIDKIYPGIVHEELDKVTHEVKSMDVIFQEYADAIMDESHERTIQMFIESQREAAERLFELANKYLNNNVVSINTGNKEGVGTRH